ncbi:hypothetical protein JHK85_037333 [Glycine max]|nr:hypothetical protein JHK85_037333 [Glycine max]
MLTTLCANNKVKFVDGSIQEHPSSLPLHATWRRCNNMMVSWLVHLVSPSIKHSIL